MSNLVVFILIGVFYLVSAVLQNMAKQAQERGSDSSQVRGNAGGGNNFIENMQRRAQEQRRDQGRAQEESVVLRPAPNRGAANRPIKARIVRNPRGSRNPVSVQRRPEPEAARTRHIHSQLEGERDLSDVDERHLAHLSGQLRSDEDLPESEQQVAPTGGRSLGNQVAINYDVDESIDINEIGGRLSPLQRAFVLSEVFAKRPGFDDGSESIRPF